MTRTPVTLVWLKDGRVIGIGRDVWSDPVEGLQVDAKGETSIIVPVEPDRTCLTDPDAGNTEGYDHRAGYDLRVLTELDPGSGGERQFLSANTLYEVEIKD